MEIAVAKILQKFGEFLFHKVYPKIENRDLRIKVLDFTCKIFDLVKEVYSRERMRKSK